MGLRMHALKEGDKVLRYYLPSANIKLAPDWDGPYMIDQKIANHTVVLKDKEGRELTSHIDKLKPFLECNTIPEKAEGTRRRDVPRRKALRPPLHGNLVVY